MASYTNDFGGLLLRSWLNILRLSILVSTLFTTSLQAKSLAGWLTPWDEPGSLDALREHAADVDVLWTMGLDYLGQGRFTYEAPKSVNVLRNGLSATARFGPMLHNMRDSAFSSELGDDLLRHRTKAIDSLKALAKEHRWTALNVDLESLDKKVAWEYEDFLRRLQKELPHVAISVDLHAKTSEPGSYSGSHFQRWNKLKKIPVDFVVMAYDHSWSTSDPAPVSPRAWVMDVAAFAARHFSKNRLIIALPQYGYHWKRSEGQWQGTSQVTPILSAKVDDTWKPVSELKVEDGRAYRKGDEAIYFDDVASFSAKSRALRERGFSRFAIWRLAGTEKAFFAEWRKMQ